MRKLLSLLLAAAMVLSLGSGVLAVDTEEDNTQYLRELYGLTDGINVLMDGTALAFEDAAPEITNSRTMLPLYAVAEALGAETDYNPATQTVTVLHQDVTLRFVIGQNSYTVEKNGVTQTVALDSAPYLKSDRTYLPLRAVAEAFGFNVQWSGDYRTAILLDKQQLIDDIDARYSILNAVLRMNVAYEGSLPAKITMTETERVSAGGETVSVSAVAEGLETESGSYVTMKYDFGELPELDEASQALMDALSETIEVRADYSSDMAYVHTKAFTQLFANVAGIDFTDDTWLGLHSAGTVSGSQLSDIEIPTFGQMLFAASYLSDLGLYDPLDSYNAVVSLADGLESIIGDAAFTDNDGAKRLTLGGENEGDMGLELDVYFTGDEATRVNVQAKNVPVETEDVALTLDCSLDLSAGGCALSYTCTTEDGDQVDVDMALAIEAAPEALMPAIPTKVVTDAEVLEACLDMSVEALNTWANEQLEAYQATLDAELKARTGMDFDAWMALFEKYEAKQAEVNAAMAEVLGSLETVDYDALAADLLADVDAAMPPEYKAFQEKVEALAPKIEALDTAMQAVDSDALISDLLMEVQAVTPDSLFTYIDAVMAAEAALSSMDFSEIVSTDSMVLPEEVQAYLDSVLTADTLEETLENLVELYMDAPEILATLDEEIANYGVVNIMFSQSDKEEIANYGALNIMVSLPDEVYEMYDAAVVLAADLAAIDTDALLSAMAADTLGYLPEDEINELIAALEEIAEDVPAMEAALESVDAAALAQTMLDDAAGYLPADFDVLLGELMGAIADASAIQEQIEAAQAA